MNRKGLEAAVSGQFKASETYCEGRGESVRVNLQYLFSLNLSKRAQSNDLHDKCEQRGRGGQDLFGQIKKMRF